MSPERLLAEQFIRKSVVMLNKAEGPQHLGLPSSDGLVAAAGHYSSVATALLLLDQASQRQQ